MNLKDQLMLEDDLVLQGVDRYLKSARAAEDRGRGSDTSYGQKLLTSLIIPVSDSIVEFREGTARKYGKYRKMLKPLDPDVISYIAIKTVLDKLHISRTVTQVAMDIGLYIEDEQRFASFKDLNPQYYASIMKDFSRKNTKAYRHMRNVLAVTSKKNGLKWDSWTKDTRLGVGTALLEQILKSTDLIRIDKKKLRNNRWSMIVVATQESIRWVSGYNDYASLLHPYTKPCIVAPDNWTGLTNGGYWSEALRHRTPFIKSLKDHEQKFIESHDLSQVYKAVNAIQSTKWSINRAVLEVLKSAWDNELPVGLPKKSPIEIPKFRVDTKPKEMDKPTFDEFIEWKGTVAQLYTDEVSRTSRAYEVSRVISMAHMYSKYDDIWFVHQCDFRGRVYASSSGLNPQGADYNKALLKFSEGKVLGQSGLYWLAVHGANCFGIDKVSFDDRVKWITDNMSFIEATAEDPLSNTEFWGEADSPFMFLAFCLEFAEGAYSPDTFVSHIPVGMDGSCNGLQNLSALLLDDVGGRATNLKPLDKPADIYQEVADRALQRMKDLPISDERTEWLAFVDKYDGLSRKIAKRPVMTLPYGCTKYACFGFVQDAIRDIDPDFFKDLNKASAYLTDVLWDSIGDVVVSAKDAMDWLQHVARITSERNLPLWWINPVGFPVYQASMKKDSYQVRTMLMGSTRLRLTSDTNELHLAKQVQGISPNFVHSLDSAHLMLTVNASIERGIKNFSMIHDDFGTHAADVETFRDIIKECFVRMYKENEPLHDLYITTALTLPDGELLPVPDSGDLDLNSIKESDYFFA